MARGLLGKAMSSANANVTLYTVPAGVQFATVQLIAANNDASDATMKVAVGTSAIPGVGDYIEHGVVVPSKGNYERTCFLMSTGENLIINANNSLISLRVMGLEEAV